MQREVRKHYMENGSKRYFDMWDKSCKGICTIDEELQSLNTADDLLEKMYCLEKLR